MEDKFKILAKKRLLKLEEIYFCHYNDKVEELRQIETEQCVTLSSISNRDKLISTSGRQLRLVYYNKRSGVKVMQLVIEQQI